MLLLLIYCLLIIGSFNLTKSINQVKESHTYHGGHVPDLEKASADSLLNLQKKVAVLEDEIKLKKQVELEKAEVEHSLRERIKELNCLYGIEQLIEKHGSSFDNFFKEAVTLLAVSWQYPEITNCRIIFEEAEYTTPHFTASEWKQAEDIRVDDSKLGAVEIYYTSQMPDIFEGPFLREERLLINAVADSVGRAVERSRLEHSIGERIKELTCLYHISQLVEIHSSSLEDIIQGTVDILPASWQYPEITHGRITYEGREFGTDGFRESRWKQTAEIKSGPEIIGSVEVYYLEEMPEIDEGPFLKEERLLINAIAERISRVSERIRFQQQLEIEHTSLENMNTALKEVLSQIENEREEVGKRVQTNVNQVIMPILYTLETQAPPNQVSYIRLLQKNLEEITSPFTSSLSNRFMGLTPVEIQICNFIKNGFSTKEIAVFRRASPATISRHREHIRKKLELNNKKVNLTTFLQTFMPN